MNLKQSVGAALIAGLAATLPATAIAQSSSIGPQSGHSLGAQRQALGLLMKPMSVDYKQTRLEAVIKNIADVTGASLLVLWQDDRNPIGLDKEALISFRAEDHTALTVLEAVLSQAGGDVTSGGNSWQMTESGMIEVGPKERLNRTKRLEIYDISDLLLEIRDYSDVPQFDLNSALQSGSGGSGSSPFSGGGTQTNQDTGKTEQERADEVIRLIVEQIEPDQWTNNGGAAATVRYYKKALLVTAPDYIQRQINGYPFWPAEQTRIDQDKSGRRVTLLPARSSGIVQTANIPQPAPASATPTPATTPPTTAESK